jgi:O-antigen/teichoic acid export membrane protein
MAGLEAYPALGKAGIVAGVAYVGASLTGAGIGGLPGALAGVAVSALLQSVILARSLISETSRQGISFRIHEIWQEASLLRQFAIPASLSGATALSALWLANAFLVRQPGGYDQMALFAAANSLKVASQLIPNMVNVVGVSLLSNQLGADDQDRYRRVYWANLVAVAAVLGLGAAALAVGGRYALRLFGEGFVQGYAVLVLMMIAAFLETICTAAAQPLQRRERMWTMFFAVILPTHCVLVMTAWRLAPSIGALGVASGYVAGWAIGLLATSLILLRIGIWKNRTTFLAG